MTTIGTLFARKPKKWGLRGDPYLWTALHELLSGVSLPDKGSEFLALLEGAFEEITGQPFNNSERFVVEEFAHGGMSSGCIDPEFWRTKAIPMLLTRYERYLISTDKKMANPSEKELDKAFEEAIKSDPAFLKWFLSKTKFKEEGINYFWSRSNHPWGKTTLEVIDPTNGHSQSMVCESETDVLVVCETPTNRRIAFHIENKTASGVFTQWQPELYQARAAQWKNDPKYMCYDDWETVLIAPFAFFEKHRTEAEKFDIYVPHELIAEFIPLFGRAKASSRIPNDIDSDQSP